MVLAKGLRGRCVCKTREHPLGPLSSPARNIQSTQPVAPQRRSIVAQVVPVEVRRKHPSTLTCWL